MVANRRTTRAARSRAARKKEERQVDPKDLIVRRWICVRRPPAENVGFEIDVWVPVEELTEEERKEHLPNITTEETTVAKETTEASAAAVAAVEAAHVAVSTGTTSPAAAPTTAVAATDLSALPPESPDPQPPIKRARLEESTSVQQSSTQPEQPTIVHQPPSQPQSELPPSLPQEQPLQSDEPTTLHNS